MKQVVWKYPLTGDYTELAIPTGGVILTAAFVDGLPYIWAQVNPDAPPASREIVMVLTGFIEVPNPSCYVTTLFKNTEFGVMVYHVYEIVGNGVQDEQSLYK